MKWRGLALPYAVDMINGEQGFAMWMIYDSLPAQALQSLHIGLQGGLDNALDNALDNNNKNTQGLALRLLNLGGRKPQTDDDTSLLRAVADGNQAALETLYHRYYPKLFRFLSSNVYDRDAIEEIINDTLHVVWQSSQQFRGESKVSTWIFGIAYRKSMAANQNTRKHRAVELTEADVASTQWEDQTYQSRHMQQSLAQLSPTHRMVVELTYYCGFSYQEIADIMACPENTVKTRMFHARKNLHQLMQHDDAPSTADSVDQA